MTATSKKSKTDRSPKSFESLMEELEKIVAKLESGELGLEASIQLFEKGMGLASEGMNRLDLAEKKVEMLLRENDKEQIVSFLPKEEKPGS